VCLPPWHFSGICLRHLIFFFQIFACACVCICCGSPTIVLNVMNLSQTGASSSTSSSGPLTSGSTRDMMDDRSPILRECLHVISISNIRYIYPCGCVTTTVFRYIPQHILVSFHRLVLSSARKSLARAFFILPLTFLLHLFFVYCQSSADWLYHEALGKAAKQAVPQRHPRGKRCVQ